MKLFICVATASIFFVSGCAATGQNLGANVYKEGQVNQAQAAKTVTILAVLPAKIEVNNQAQKKEAEVVGAVLGAFLGAAAGQQHGMGSQGAAVGGVTGAAAGSLVKDKVLVDGVSLTYVIDNQTLNSAQVGKLCEYKPGLAIMISASPTETRIQPNAACPATSG